MPTRIAIGAVSGSDISAVIEKIAPIATDENGTNTFEIKAALNIDTLTTKLRAGYSANATIILEKAENTLSIPERVVEYNGDSAFVYILQNTNPQQFTRTAITTGVSDGLQVELKSPNLDKSTQFRGNRAN